VGALINKKALNASDDASVKSFNKELAKNAGIAVKLTKDFLGGFANDVSTSISLIGKLFKGTYNTSSVGRMVISAVTADVRTGLKSSVKESLSFLNPKQPSVDTYKNKINSTSYEYVLFGGGGTDAIEHLRDALREIEKMSTHITREVRNLPDYLNVMVHLLDHQSDKRPIALFLHIVHCPAPKTKGDESLWLNSAARSLLYPGIGAVLAYGLESALAGVSFSGISGVATNIVWPIVAAFLMSHIKNVPSVSTWSYKKAIGLLRAAVADACKGILPFVERVPFRAMATGASLLQISTFVMRALKAIAVELANNPMVGDGRLRDIFLKTLTDVGFPDDLLQRLEINSSVPVLVPIVKLIGIGVAKKMYDLAFEPKNEGYEMFMDFDATEKLELKRRSISKFMHIVQLEDPDGSVREIKVLAKDEDAELAACLQAGNFDHFNECETLLDGLQATLSSFELKPSLDDISTAFHKLSDQINNAPGLQCHGVQYASIQSAVSSEEQRSIFITRVHATIAAIKKSSQRALPRSLQLDQHWSEVEGANPLLDKGLIDKVAKGAYIGREETRDVKDRIKNNSEFADAVFASWYVQTGSDAKETASRQMKIVEFANSAYATKDFVLATRTMPQTPVLVYKGFQFSSGDSASRCELSALERKSLELELVPQNDTSGTGLSKAALISLKTAMAFSITVAFQRLQDNGTSSILDAIGFPSLASWLAVFKDKTSRLYNGILTAACLWIVGVGGTNPDWVTSGLHAVNLLIQTQRVLENGNFFLDAAVAAVLSPWEQFKSLETAADDAVGKHKTSLVYKRCLLARFGNPVERSKSTLSKLCLRYNEGIASTLEAMDRSLLLNETLVAEKAVLLRFPVEFRMPVRNDVAKKLQRGFFAGLPRRTFVAIEEVEVGRNIHACAKNRVADSDRDTNREYQSSLLTKFELTVALGNRSTLLESRSQRLQRVTESASRMLQFFSSGNARVTQSSLIWTCQEGGVAALCVALNYSVFADYMHESRPVASFVKNNYWTPRKQALLSAFLKHYKEALSEDDTQRMLEHGCDLGRVLSAACPKERILSLFADEGLYDGGPGYALSSDNLGVGFWADSRIDEDVLSKCALEYANTRAPHDLFRMGLTLGGGAMRTPKMHYHCPACESGLGLVLVHRLMDVAEKLSHNIHVLLTPSESYTISNCTTAEGQSRHPLVMTLEEHGPRAVVASCNFARADIVQGSDETDRLGEAARSLCFNCERAFYAIKWAYEFRPAHLIVFDVEDGTTHLCTSYALAATWAGLPMASDGMRLAMSCQSSNQQRDCGILLSTVVEVCKLVLRSGIQSASVSSLAAAIYLRSSDHKPQ